MRQSLAIVDMLICIQYNSESTSACIELPLVIDKYLLIESFLFD